MWVQITEKMCIFLCTVIHCLVVSDHYVLSLSFTSAGSLFPQFRTLCVSQIFFSSVCVSAWSPLFHFSLGLFHSCYVFFFDVRLLQFCLYYWHFSWFVVLKSLCWAKAIWNHVCTNPLLACRVCMYVFWYPIHCKCS